MGIGSENGKSNDLSAELRDWSKLRKAKPAEHLLPSGKKFLDQLPPEVFPSALASYYPRIVNLFALQWKDRSACAAYFDEPLFDRRGGRQGFPPAIEQDLQRLRGYWRSAYPAWRV